MKVKILLALVLLMVAVQFVPYGKDQSNPPVSAEPVWANPETRTLFFRACGDCHSHETHWPWYSKIAPVSWLIQQDVEEGRGHFNVSLWGIQKKNKGDEAAEELRDGEMPPWLYLIPHSEARLSKNEKKKLIGGLLATFGGER